MENEAIVHSFSHGDKIYGLSSAGHLAEWSVKELKWVVRGSNEVIDHATHAKMTRTSQKKWNPDVPAIEDGKLAELPGPWIWNMILSLLAVGVFSVMLWAILRP